MTTPTTTHTEILKLRTNLKVLEDFLTIHPSSLPENLLTFSITGDAPRITVYKHNIPNDDGVQRVLAAVGDDWGRDGWVKNPDYYNRNWHWDKTLHGVQLHLEDIETIPPFVTQPVHPTSFPLQLTDVEIGTDS